MFDASKMYKDVTRMIKDTAKQRLPVTDAMRPWLSYCRDATPGECEIWRQLSSLDFESDFQHLTNWLIQVLRDEPIPESINGVWFGMYYPIDVDLDSKRRLHWGKPTCRLYLSGSTRFSETNWACDPEYWPEGRYSNSEVLTTIYRSTQELKGDVSPLGDGCLCQGYAASVISNWCSGALAQQLIGPQGQRAVAMGFDSGDMHFIHLPTN